jgi:hypothetical protein
MSSNYWLVTQPNLYNSTRLMPCHTHAPFLK